MNNSQDATWREKSVRCMKRTTACLSMMSLGKYSTKLYHRGRTDYSCCVSGVITLLLVLFSVLASVSILSTTFSKEVYTLTETTYPLN